MVSVRYTSGVAGIRISSYFYNNRQDMDRLFNAVEDYMSSKLAVQSEVSVGQS